MGNYAPGAASKVSPAAAASAARLPGAGSADSGLPGPVALAPGGSRRLSGWEWPWSRVGTPEGQGAGRRVSWSWGPPSRALAFMGLGEDGSSRAGGEPP